MQEQLNIPNGIYKESDTSYYIKSDYIKVYPSAFRGKISNTDTPIDPEAILYTEKNITNSGINLGNDAPHNSYIATGTIDLTKGETTAAYNKVIIAGYTFLISKDIIDYFKIIDDVYLNIKLSNFNLVNDEKSTRLASWTGSNESLDQIGHEDNEEVSYFSGLKITIGSVEPNASYSLNISINNLDRNATIITDNIFNEAITANKLGNDLIDTGVCSANNITITMTQSITAPHKFNIDIQSDYVNNANNLVDEDNNVIDSGEIKNNNFADLVYFRDGRTETANEIYSTAGGNVGSGVQPVYISAGKIVGSTATVVTNFGTTTNQTYSPIELVDGKFTTANNNTVTPHGSCTTVGSATNPVYMESGEFKAITGTVGGSTQPIYMENGKIKPLDGSIGSDTQPIFLSNGVLTASTKTTGGTVNPVYLSNGVLTPISGSVGGFNDGVPTSYELIYLNNGEISKADESKSLGSTKKPLYISKGKLVEGSQMYSQALTINSTPVGTIARYNNSDINITLGNGLSYNTSTGLSVIAATTTTYGGIKTGFTKDDTNKKYPVELDNDSKAYVAVPWQNTTYTAGSNINLNGTEFSLYNDISVATVTASGGIKANDFYARSDKRLKENIKDFNYDRSILDLPIKTFDFKDGAKNQIGCIAQDLQQIYPELVTEDNNGYLAIQENKLVYLLLEEVKQLKQEIAELKKKDRN